MSEQIEKFNQLQKEINDYVADAKNLRNKFNKLISEIEPIYKDITNKQGHLFRLQDEVKKYGIVKGHLNLDYLIELLEGIKQVDKTPIYKSYYSNEPIAENMKNKMGELPPEYSSWITPSNIAEIILNLINEKSYEIPYSQLYYKDER